MIALNLLISARYPFYPAHRLYKFYHTWVWGYSVIQTVLMAALHQYGNSSFRSKKTDLLWQVQSRVPIKIVGLIVILCWRLWYRWWFISFLPFWLCSRSTNPFIWKTIPTWAHHTSKDWLQEWGCSHFCLLYVGSVSWRPNSEKMKWRTVFDRILDQSLAQYRLCTENVGRVWVVFAGLC